MFCKFFFVHKQLLPSENFLLASFIITKEENTHAVEVSGKTAMDISKAAISTSYFYQAEILFCKDYNILFFSLNERLLCMAIYT